MLPATAHRIFFDWLALRDAEPLTPCDAVIGFGHFDLAIPRRCAELVRAGKASHLIFTGGIGAGTADLGMAEADAFITALAREHADLAARAVCENRSTNTAENIRFTRELLLATNPRLALGSGIRSVLLVATPCRQRRVFLTWRKLMPDIPAVNLPPLHTFESLAALYASKGDDLVQQMLNEYQRLRDYPAKGWIAEAPIPTALHEAAHALSSCTHSGSP